MLAGKEPATSMPNRCNKKSGNLLRKNVWVESKIIFISGENMILGTTSLEF